MKIDWKNPDAPSAVAPFSLLWGCPGSAKLVLGHSIGGGPRRNLLLRVRPVDRRGVPRGARFVRARSASSVLPTRYITAFMKHGARGSGAPTRVAAVRPRAGAFRR